MYNNILNVAILILYDILCTICIIFLFFLSFLIRVEYSILYTQDYPGTLFYIIFKSIFVYINNNGLDISTVLE